MIRTIAGGPALKNDTKREAIRRLSSEGLIIMDTHRDSRVADVSASEARELLEVRLSLEPSATELAAHRRTDADIAAMPAGPSCDYTASI